MKLREDMGGGGSQRKGRENIGVKNDLEGSE